MLVLVACEYSGRVRDAFAARGHAAYSCDILPTESPGPHFQCDVREILSWSWDLVIAFPPCTRLTTTGNRWFPAWQADGSQEAAVEFFFQFTQLDHVPRVAIENPRGIMSSRYRKPDQYVHPWWFGDPWTKQTGLWLKGLPKLVADRPVEPTGYWVSGGSTTRDGKRESREGAKAIQREGTNAARRHARSLTHQGIARAMAEQWG